MIRNIVNDMLKTISQLKQYILDDIEDVKQANHENLLDRNDLKLASMEQLAQYKIDLNKQLSLAFQNGDNLDQYRVIVDNLENELLELSQLNSKLGAIVLPVKEMYKDIIDEISKANGGSVIEVRA